MEIKLENLWDEFEFNETLKEHVEGKVDKYIEKISEQIDRAIEKRITSAIADMNRELSIAKTFSECADTKINKHLLTHSNKEKEE